MLARKSLLSTISSYCSKQKYLNLSTIKREASYALVRYPSQKLNEGLVTHISRSDSVNYTLAIQQWNNYVRILQDYNFNIVNVPKISAPDSVFVEDTVVIIENDVAIIARPGALSREDEVVEVRRTLEKMIKKENIKTILHPGYLDGGDVLKVGKTIYVGYKGRTNLEGVAQLRLFVESLQRGYEVIAVPVVNVLHLKSMVTALPNGTIVGYLPLMCQESVNIFKTTGRRNFLEVPEESGAHVLILENKTILISNDCPKSKALFLEQGLKVVTADISEFIKLEGCVTCLSVRIRSPQNIENNTAK